MTARQPAAATLFAFAAIFAAASPGTCRTAGPPRLDPPSNFGVDATFDARRVHDLYALSRALTSAPGKTQLVLFDVTPDDEVRSAGGNREAAKPPAKEDAIIDSGAFAAVGGLGCAPQSRSGTYRWETPLGWIAWRFRYLDPTDPFEVGGTAAIPPPGSLSTHPEPTYSIWPEYLGFLQGELAFSRAHPSWTEVAGTGTGLAFVKEQLKNSNPLIVMEATRALSAAGKLDSPTAAALVSEGPEIQQALETVAVLCGMTKEEEATLGQAILDAIDGAKTAEDLKNLFIGATVAYTVAWDEQERTVQVHVDPSLSPVVPLPLTGTAPFLQSVFIHAVDRERAMPLHGAAAWYMKWLERGEDWAYDEPADYLQALAAGRFQGGASATGPSAPNPASPAPAGDSTTPHLALSKEDRTRIDDLGKATGKPLTYDQEVDVLKAVRAYQAMVREGRRLFDERVAKALSITLDDLHRREKKFHHDEAMQKETTGAAPPP